MKNLTRLMLALAAGIVVLPAFADERIPLSAQAAATHSAAALQPLRVRATQAGNAAQPKVMGTNTFPGTPGANPFRAYPPSCAADPLPDMVSGTTATIYSQRVTLFARDASGTGYTEGVTVTVWRLACSSSSAATPYNPSGASNAMTLMRIDRDSIYEHTRDIFPTFPVVEASQAGSAFGTTASLVRSAAEPNTVVSEASFDSPMYDSTTYVLENYPYTGSGYFTFSDAFTLRIDPVISGVAPVDFAIPAYSPTPSTYPDAFNLLPFDGYAAAQWINSALNEGLLLQVTEQPQANGSTVRQLVFDLLTKDLNGDPLWLVGNAAFQVGDSSVTIQTNYLGNGLAQLPWGTAKFEFADCNHLDVTFAANAQLPAPIPAFNGLTTYDRLFSANGMLCE
jgi:hypothetical protein